MKNADTRDFLEEMEHGEGFVRYHGKDYFVHGCMFKPGEDGKPRFFFMDIYDMTARTFVWKTEKQTPEEAMKAFLSEPLIDGRTFWELEPELEWTEGPGSAS